MSGNPGTLKQESADFSEEKLESKYLGWILGQKFPVITTQLYCHSAKETIDYINK